MSMLADLRFAAVVRVTRNRHIMRRPVIMYQYSVLLADVGDYIQVALIL